MANQGQVVRAQFVQHGDFLVATVAQMRMHQSFYDAHLRHASDRMGKSATRPSGYIAARTHDASLAATGKRERVKLFV